MKTHNIFQRSAACVVRPVFCAKALSQGLGWRSSAIGRQAGLWSMLRIIHCFRSRGPGPGRWIYGRADHPYHQSMPHYYQPLCARVGTGIQLNYATHTGLCVPPVALILLHLLLHPLQPHFHKRDCLNIIPAAEGGKLSINNQCFCNVLPFIATLAVYGDLLQTLAT